MSLDGRERFRDAATAGLYGRYRPSYPDALVDWILTTARAEQGSAVADVGCGTGISTRLLAARGLDVVGIDPSEEMLVEARREGGARYERGEAAATGLGDASVALVSVAQAFHWFELSAALREFARILRPGGQCVAFWNVRALHAGFMADYDALLKRFSREYAIIDKPMDTLAELKARPEVREPREAAFEYVQGFDFEALHGRVWSSSYVIHGVPDREGFERELRTCFERHASDGRIAFRYRTLALAFRIDPQAFS